MFNKEFDFMEKRLVFNSFDRVNGEQSIPAVSVSEDASDGADATRSVENAETYVQETREQLSTASTEIERRLAASDPKAYLSIQNTVAEGQDASPAQILAVRKCLTMIFSQTDGNRSVLPFTLALREGLGDSTDRLSGGDFPLILGMTKIDAAMLTLRILTGNQLGTNALQINTEFINILNTFLSSPQFENHDPSMPLNNFDTGARSGQLQVAKLIIGNWLRDNPNAARDASGNADRFYTEELARQEEQDELARQYEEEFASEEQRRLMEDETVLSEVNAENIRKLSIDAWQRMTTSRADGQIIVNRDYVRDYVDQQRVQAWIDVIFLTDKTLSFMEENVRYSVSLRERLGLATRIPKLVFFFRKLGLNVDPQVLQNLSTDDETWLNQAGNTFLLNINKLRISTQRVSGVQVIEGEEYTRITENEILITWDTPGLDNTTIHYIKGPDGRWSVGALNDDYSSNPIASLT